MEFAFSSIVIVMVLLTTIEFGIEMFIRQTSERAVSTATTSYAVNRSKALADEAILNSVPYVLRRCMQPIDVQLMNTIRGKDLSGDSVGFKALDNNGDISAEFARVTFTCDWSRITPASRFFFGPTFTTKSVAYTRMRDGL